LNTPTHSAPGIVTMPGQGHQQGRDRLDSQGAGSAPASRLHLQASRFAPRKLPPPGKCTPSRAPTLPFVVPNFPWWLANSLRGLGHPRPPRSHL
uniref:Uncharacterized protein n=1 Tax=Felis catus TaxID=9685 RepID=A0ABI7YP46_FELCA